MKPPCLVRPASEILFFDDAEIESLVNVTLAVCEAEKHPLNPVLGVGDLNEWDSAQCSPWPVRTVLYDAEEKLFKAWYGGSSRGAAKTDGWRMGYALSADGVHWEKPSLGLFEFNGSRRNNIIHSVPYGAVIKDVTEPDSRKRYKRHMRDFVLATLRLDGFTCLHAEDLTSFGTATTRVLTAEKSVGELALNVSRTRPGRDWAQVEVLDVAGAPLPGYGRTECAPICREGIAEPVRWGGKSLGAIGHRTFRLRFHLFGAARLHAAKFGKAMD